MSETYTILGIGLHVLLFLATWFGNTLVCVAIWRFRALHSVSNMLIFSLAIADILMTEVFVFRVIVISSEKELPTACHGIAETGFSLICVIILHLSCISVDRLIAIECPLRYQCIVTRRRMKLAIVAIWFSALFGNLALPHALPRRDYEDFINYYDSFYLCITAHNHNFKNTSKILARVIISFYFVIPFVVTLSSYAYVMRVSRQQQVRLRREAHLESAKLRKLEIKAVITFGIVTGAFMLCFLPLFVGTLYQQFKPDERHNMIRAMQVLSIIASVSACVNPAVYTCRDRLFRKSFKTILVRNKRARRKRQQRSSEVNVESREEFEMKHPRCEAVSIKRLSPGHSVTQTTATD